MSTQSPTRIGLPDYESAIADLREKLPTALKHPDIGPIVAAREEVLAHYGPVFRANEPSNVNLEEFRAFLDFRNNRHWGGLHRQVGSILSDPEALREAICTLADESRPVEQRFDKAVSAVQGMGRAIVTAVLHVAYPDKYAVWNNTAELALKRTGLWPTFERGDSSGAKYLKINDVIKRVAVDLELDLWTLDAVWWALVQDPAKLTPSAQNQWPGSEDTHSISETPEQAQAFGLERHLHDFLVDNWARMDLAKEWDVYSEEGDRLTGFEYPTAIGSIDLLCKHKREPRWLVIELKRGQTSDSTVGQVLRYIGWIQQKVASAGEKVEGLIIAHTSDQALEYALAPLPNVRLYLYEVEFRLVPLEGG